MNSARGYVGNRTLRRGPVLVALMLSLVMAAPPAAYAGVSVMADETPRVDGTVFAIAQVGTRTIIGGEFTGVGGQARNHVAAIKADGTLDRTFNPDVNGIVYAVAGSADGSTIFIGGRFTRAGGADRANLAAVDAVTGAARADWRADTTGTYPDVRALAVSGSRLFVGGAFGQIDGVARKRLAALSASDGEVIRLFNPAPNGAAVKFLAVNPSGATVYAGGMFDVIGGQSRPGVAELYADTGLTTRFTPQDIGSGVVAMGISPTADRLFFGVADNRVLAYDVASSVLLWTIKNAGNTQAIAVTNTEIYMGGHFGQNTTQKIKRRWILSTHLDGTVTEWNPNLAGGSWGIWALVTTPSALLVGGEFYSVAGVYKPYFARFSGTP